MELRCGCAKGIEMKNFLTNSACNGCRPKGMGRRKRYTRPRLMKRMMEERHVARILSAPEGFGKTTLVLEYAESIFGFHNVFWTDCQSPCFLRDLDAGIIADTLIECGSTGALVVFEDVPYLDDGRATELSSAFDTLLTNEWEIVATMLPPFDSFAERQPDRVVVEASDFVVDDAELEAFSHTLRKKSFSRAERVSVLVWGEDDERDAFYRSLKGIEMPAEMRLAMITMLILQEGDFEDLGEFVRGLKRDTRRFLARHYPHMGIDLVSEEFHTIDVPIDVISGAYTSSMDAAAEKAGSMSRDAFSIRLADTLVSKGAYQRSCETMKALCSRKRRMSWIERQNDTFLKVGQIVPIQDLFESLGSRPTGLSPRCIVDAAVRLRLLGDKQAAARMSSRAMSHPDITFSLGCEAALVCEECGQDEHRRHAVKVLEGMARPVYENQDLPDDDTSLLRHIAASHLAIPQDPMRAVTLMLPYENHLSTCPVALGHILYLLVCASGHTFREGSVAWSRSAREAVCSLVLRCVTVKQEAYQPTLFEALVIDTLSSLTGDVLGSFDWKHTVDNKVVGLSLQRAEWLARRPKRGMASLSSRNNDDKEQSLRYVPEMKVKLFGGMEVRIGGRIIAPGSFKKQKAKTLLAALVLHRGHEVPRQELLDIMWPSADWDRAVANFYSLWSVLRKTIADSDGECPYLVRHQTSCMVDARYVHSDVEDFEELCRTLMFDTPDPHAWMEVFEQLSSNFFCDLLPSETDNLYIIGMRAKFKARTVDACVAGANRLCDIDASQTALWFAHAAYELDRTREDVYYALMRSQMMSGRRTSAMETYFAYLKFMGEELGLEPSKHIVRLYDEILTSKL